MMGDSTKLYNTVQVQKLEAELQLMSETLPSDLWPLTSPVESLQFQTKSN